jgi:hypothetical protein
MVLILFALIAGVPSSFTGLYRRVSPEETPYDGRWSHFGRSASFLPTLPLKYSPSWAHPVIPVRIQIEYPLEDLELFPGVWLFFDFLGSQDILWTPAVLDPPVPRIRGIIHLDWSGLRKFRTEFVIGPKGEYDESINGQMGGNRRSRFVSQYPAFAIDRIGGAIVLGATAIHRICDGRMVTAAVIDSEFWDMHGKLNGREVVLRVGFGSQRAGKLELPSAVFAAYIASISRDISFTSRGIEITNGCDDEFVPPGLILKLRGALMIVPMMSYMFIDDDGSCELRIAENTRDDIFVLGQWFWSSIKAAQFNDHDEVFKICY